MTTNMENYQQLQTPLMIISVIGYYLIILSAAFPGSTFIKVMASIPLMSVSLAPSLFAFRRNRCWCCNNWNNTFNTFKLFISKIWS